MRQAGQGGPLKTSELQGGKGEGPSVAASPACPRTHEGQCGWGREVRRAGRRGQRQVGAQRGRALRFVVGLVGRLWKVLRAAGSAVWSDEDFRRFGLAAG